MSVVKDMMNMNQMGASQGQLTVSLKGFFLCSSWFHIKLIQFFPDSRRSWKKKRGVISAAEVAEEQIVN